MSGTVGKALKVLELLSTYDEPVRLADLSRVLGMNKSTTYRLLETMSKLGYVRQSDGDSRYMLTARMWAIGVRAFHRFDIRVWARPYLEELLGETQETAVLAVLEGNEVVIVEKRDSDQAVQALSPLGSRSPLHCSSLGKGLLMGDTDRLLKLVRRPLKAFTPQTITSIVQLRAEVEDARRRGVAVAFDEYLIGVSGASAPVLGVDGALLGAIGVSLPTIRAEGKHLERAKALVRERSAALSCALGYVS